MSVSKTKKGKFESIIDLYSYDKSSLDEKKNILIQKNIFLKGSGVANNDIEIFYFNTNLIYDYNGISYVINEAVCIEFYDQINNYIEEKGIEYEHLILEKINKRINSVKSPNKDEIVCSIKSKIIDSSIEETRMEVYSNKLNFEEEVIKNFGDELFIYLTKGFSVITNEIDNYFCLKYGSEFLNHHTQLNEDEYLDFLYDNYCFRDPLDHTDDFCLDPDIEYINYKYGNIKEFINYDEFTRSSKVSEETFYRTKQIEFCKFLIDKYIDINEEFFGHTIMVYNESPKEFNIIKEWLKLYEIDFINNSFKNILKESNLNDFSIFTKNGEELFNKVLREYNVLDDNGKAKARGFQPICDALFCYHEDYFKKIFTKNLKKKDYILFLRKVYDAKIKDLTKLSSGEKYINDIRLFIKDELKSLKMTE